MTTPETSALVLFSGGQDSTVCLAWALAHYDRVETIGFKYGQRHSVELAQRHVVRDKLAKLGKVGGRLGPDAVLDLPALQSISDTALTRETEITFAATGLPTTFVPGRNLLFLTYAAALAYRRGITTLVGGMCETDFSGYPDCRNETIQTLAQAISLGLATPMTIETPLMFIDKAGTWAMASELGGDDLIKIIIEDTHTCYMGDRTNRHDWGYGCGICPACELRAKGWIEWQSQQT
ncbi:MULTISPECIES: 7-cyano-7-deazaguanine synthase QueC [unclassified Hyphomicrobium]|uniref:7-cyano-7-deazaguanine synthase QueC n=1 Tax=unclassified Hyphomicrobium TaxID=2619925 RepID=UPI000213DF76|nr:MULTISPECIES: 7-cyano-7-deazaguanine synthase QueC [unclassified Hyphomicrobium]CCB65187.1 Queuosine biosynthesis protein QueC [Hyphomicrobium sp. MC1]